MRLPKLYDERQFAKQHSLSRYKCNLCGHVAFDINNMTAHFSHAHRDSGSCSGKYTALERNRWQCPLDGCAGNVLWQGSSIKSHLNSVHDQSMEEFAEKNGLDEAGSDEDDEIVEDGEDKKAEVTDEDLLKPPDRWTCLLCGQKTNWSRLSARRHLSRNHDCKLDEYR